MDRLPLTAFALTVMILPLAVGRGRVSEGSIERALDVSLESEQPSRDSGSRARVSESVRPDTALLRVGISPTALAAAGVRTSQVASAFEQARAVLAAEGAALEAADRELAAQRREVRRLTQLRLCGKLSPSDLASLAQLERSIADRQGQRAGILLRLRQACESGLGGECSQTVENLRRPAPLGTPSDVRAVGVGSVGRRSPDPAASAIIRTRLSSLLQPMVEEWRRVAGR